HVLHGDEAAAVVLREEAQVIDLHEVLLAVGVVTGQQPGQDQGVAEQVGGGLLGEPRLPRHLDGHGAKELPAEILLGPEDDAEGPAGAGLDEPVLAGEGAAEEAFFEGRRAAHGRVPRGGPGARGLLYRMAAGTRGIFPHGSGETSQRLSRVRSLAATSPSVRGDNLPR